MTPSLGELIVQEYHVLQVNGQSQARRSTSNTTQYDDDNTTNQQCASRAVVTTVVDRVTAVEHCFVGFRASDPR